MVLYSRSCGEKSAGPHAGYEERFYYGFNSCQTSKRRHVIHSSPRTIKMVKYTIFRNRTMQVFGLKHICTCCSKTRQKPMILLATDD